MAILGPIFGLEKAVLRVEAYPNVRFNTGNDPQFNVKSVFG